MTAYYNSGLTSTLKDANNNGPITDLASNLTSCWSNNTSDGREMTVTDGLAWYFPAYYYNKTYSGQIIGINNHTGSAWWCTPVRGAHVFSNGIWNAPGDRFQIESYYIYVYMLTSENYWIQIAKSSNN